VSGATNTINAQRVALGGLAVGPRTVVSNTLNEDRAAIASSTGPMALAAFDAVGTITIARDIWGRLIWAGIYSDGFQTGDASSWSSATP